VVGWIFSEISICLILPLIFGVLILAFPTVIADVLGTIHIYLPSWLWGGSEVPLQYILTIGITAFVPTLDWLGVIVSGMLVGYIAGALMERSRMRGNTGFASMLKWSTVAAIIGIVFTTQTYIWYSPMFSMNINGMSYLEAVSFAYFIYIVIYGVFTILAAFIGMVASWFRPQEVIE
jgi:hypothetical protein